ncbi:hypothetical protein CNMCM5878_003910 [Aspergillus fumigatiaffinis]|nr:hypothetical protein CNMCM5878_003910 [Aspergillus fumigatiaffinis]
MDSLSLKQRAERIAQMATSLVDELSQTGHPEPSFEHGHPPPLHATAPPSTAKSVHRALTKMVNELHALLIEPSSHLSSDHRLPSLSIHSIIRLGIAANFPGTGTTVPALAKTLQLDERLVRRLLKHSATYHVFYEATPDFFVHTAASRFLTENQGVRDWVLLSLEESLPGMLKVAEALKKYAGSEEPEHCGWSLANGTDRPIYRALAEMPERAKRFSDAMTWRAKSPGYSPEHLIAVFPWPSDCEGFTVVDVGGGLGHVSRTLAAHAPKARFIVQDMDTVVTQANSLGMPQGQVCFQSHDFFKTQPVQGADVYLLRWILHNWSDKYAAKILRALIPAMKVGSKVVINDRVVPDYHTAHYLVEREARDLDLYMLGFQNARERTSDDWTALLKAADSRFQITAIQKPVDSVLSVIEVTLNG